MKQNGERENTEKRINISKASEANKPAKTAKAHAERKKTKVKTLTVKSGSKKPFPFGLVFILLIFTVLLMMCVSNYVTLNEYTRDVSELRAELDELKTEEKKLNAELERKYDLVELDKYAKEELGLVGAGDVVNKKYIEVGDDEKIEVYETEEEGTVGAITNALFALADNLLKSWNNLLGNE